MISTQTTLVLGAGASNPYGFPLGSELRTELCSIYQDMHGITWPFSTEQIDNFKVTFKNSSVDSIDRFLSLRPEF